MLAALVSQPFEEKEERGKCTHLWFGNLQRHFLGAIREIVL